MPSFGEIRGRLVTAYPQVHQDLIDGWLNDRYTEILGRLAWTRLDVDIVLQTVAPYSTGTLALTGGADAIALACGAFTEAMDGRYLRVTGRDEIYQFTYVAPDSGTLDRPYEGDDDNSAEYMLFKHVYALPADCRLVRELVSPKTGRSLDRMTRGELNASAPSRAAVAAPRVWTWAMDAATDPPVMQIELYPIPDAVYAIPLIYTADKAALTGTGQSFSPWVDAAPLIAGATADIREFLKDYAGADRAVKRFEELVTQLINNEARRKGPQQLKMADRFTRHRLARTLYGLPRSSRL